MQEIFLWNDWVQHRFEPYKVPMFLPCSKSGLISMFLVGALEKQTLILLFSFDDVLPHFLGYLIMCFHMF